MASGHTGNVVPRKGLRVRNLVPSADFNRDATRTYENGQE